MRVKGQSANGPERGAISGVLAARRRTHILDSMKLPGFSGHRARAGRVAAAFLASSLLIALLAACGSLGGGAAGSLQPVGEVEVFIRSRMVYESPELGLDWDGGMLISRTRREYVYDQPWSSTPSGTSVAESETVLEPDRADGLWKTVNRLFPAFLALEGSYGAPETERFYGYRLEITMNGETKCVIHRSNPGYGGPPAVFSELVAALKAASGD